MFIELDYVKRKTLFDFSEIGSDKNSKICDYFAVEFPCQQKILHSKRFIGKQEARNGSKKIISIDTKENNIDGKTLQLRNIVEKVRIAKFSLEC